MAMTQPTTTAVAAGWLSAAQMRTLEASCEALIPSVPPPTGETDPTGFYARSARELGVARRVAEALATEPPETLADFRRLLDLLGNPLAGVALAGHPRPFARLPLEARQAALRRMSTSGVARLRQGFQGLKRLALDSFYSATDARGDNPSWPAIGYPPPSPPTTAEQAPKRLRPLPVEGDLSLSADVVIVGSGAGGSMVAAQLAAAGLDVLVLEKGGYFSEADFTGREGEMTERLFLRRGLLTTRDLGLVVLAGSCLGGGTVVNWSTSLRTPPNVLEEWERAGLSGATGPAYQEGFAVAERRLGVTTDDSAPNRNNDMLRRGAEALGWAWQTLPRNASGCAQRCGACGFGCPHGRKQSATLTFLHDAQEAGVRFVVGCQAERVVIEAGRATGVEGWARDTRTGQRRRVVARASRVVVAAGAIESPALLLRSGLTNPHIGRHLHLHPVTALAGEYAESVEPWIGSPQTVMVDEFAQVDGAYGFRCEVMPAHPGLLALAYPWESGAQHKRLMTGIARRAVPIVLARDSGEGRITLDSRGDPVVRYWPGERDRQRLIHGMREMARLLVASGATAIHLTHTPYLGITAEDGRPGAISAARLAAFQAEITRRDIFPNRVLVGTAHQMGTCRVGASERAAVVDPTGAVFGVRGLFVADASGFPSASGVNPMLSIYALAYHVARHLVSAE